MDNKEKPPKFSDVLGALVNSVAHGRKVADVGALHIARSYYKNEYLKGLPIPRLRIDKVNISLPLMLSEVIEGKPAEPNEPEKIANQVIKAFDKSLINEQKTLDALKELNTGKLTDDQEKALKIYQNFIKSWDETWSQGNDKSGKIIFKEQFCKQIRESFNDLERTEGEIKPSDVSIMDAAGNAAKEVLKDLMEKLFFKLEQEQQNNDKKDSLTVEQGMDIISERTYALRTALSDKQIDFDIAFTLLGVLKKVTFDGSINKQAQEVERHNSEWKTEIDNALYNNTINEDLANYLKNAGLPSPDTAGNTRGIRGAVPPVEKFDKAWVDKTLKELPHTDYAERLLSSVSDAAEKAAIKRSTIPPDFCVVVNTENIKNNGGGPEAVTRLNMVLHEEGLEWMTDKDKTTLMPE